MAVEIKVYSLVDVCMGWFSMDIVFESGESYSFIEFSYLADSIADLAKAVPSCPQLPQALDLIQGTEPNYSNKRCLYSFCLALEKALDHICERFTLKD